MNYSSAYGSQLCVIRVSKAIWLRKLWECQGATEGHIKWPIMLCLHKWEQRCKGRAVGVLWTSPCISLTSALDVFMFRLLFQSNIETTRKHTSSQTSLLTSLLSNRSCSLTAFIFLNSPFELWLCSTLSNLIQPEKRDERTNLSENIISIQPIYSKYSVGWKFLLHNII